MALAAQTPTTESNAPLSSVHPQETTTQEPVSLTYREKLIVLCKGEYDATESAYKQWDAEEKTFRQFDLEECRDNAWFAIHMPSRTVRILSSACRLRWCPLCSQGRTARIVEALEPWVRSRSANKFLTLTLKHSDESLESQIIRLYAAFSAFRRRRYISKSIAGGIWFFQIKFSEKNQQWHPHLHCILDAEYMPHATLKSIWKDVTGDSDIVDIRAIRDPKKAAEYVARYAARPCKLEDLTTEQAVEVMRALHGRRLTGTFGTGKEVKTTKPTVATKDEYFSICAFGDIKRLAKKSVFAEKIREAYTKNEPLEICCSREALGELYEKMCDLNRTPIPPPVEDSQLKLFDTGPACNCYS